MFINGTSSLSTTIFSWKVFIDSYPSFPLSSSKSPPSSLPPVELCSLRLPEIGKDRVEGVRVFINGTSSLSTTTFFWKVFIDSYPSFPLPSSKSPPSPLPSVELCSLRLPTIDKGRVDRVRWFIHGSSSLSKTILSWKLVSDAYLLFALSSSKSSPKRREKGSTRFFKFLSQPESISNCEMLENPPRKDM